MTFALHPFISPTSSSPCSPPPLALSSPVSPSSPVLGSPCSSPRLLSALLSPLLIPSLDAVAVAHHGRLSRAHFQGSVWRRLGCLACKARSWFSWLILIVNIKRIGFTRGGERRGGDGIRFAFQRVVLVSVAVLSHLAPYYCLLGEMRGAWNYRSFNLPSDYRCNENKVTACLSNMYNSSK